MDAPKLEKQVKRREEIVLKLEHAINIKTIRKRDPRHLTARGEQVLSIPTYTRELNNLNESISETISRIDTLKREEKKKFRLLMEQKKVRSILNTPMIILSMQL